MITKIALLIIYNHRYDKNISKIETLMSGKFSYVFHIVPFYDGNLNNVITVYDTSYCFGGYIAQAYEHIKHMGFTHYFIIADDMLLSPHINEKNLFVQLGINQEINYTPVIHQFGVKKDYWIHSADAVFYTAKRTGAEIYNVLPSKKEAREHFRELGLNSAMTSRRVFWKAVFCRRILLKSLFQISQAFCRFIKSPFGKYELEYPLVGGYVDVCLLTAKTMPKVCQYIGAFSATGLFVEIALPTSIALASDHLVTEQNLRLKGGTYWDTDIPIFEDRYNRNLDKLIAEYPKDLFYIHPVKLSRWKSNLFR